MQNIGEEICGEYLRNIIQCNFISYNVINPDVQGEIDVVGIKLEENLIYLCEVATHTGGLQYVTNKRPDDFNRFLHKFIKNIDYANKYFPNYNIKLMLWSPIVKISGEKAKYNTYKELSKLKDKILKDYSLDLALIINDEYNNSLNLLKDFAAKTSSMFTSNIMRVFQIEKYLEKHLKNLKKRNVL
jgi:hypothetical protein